MGCVLNNSTIRLLSQQSNPLTDFTSSSPSLVPIIKDAIVETVDERSGFWAGDSQGLLCRAVTIGTLPDDVLLEVFSLYLKESYKAFGYKCLESWGTLVHVCQRWRRVVFASPCRLKLRLVCTVRRPVREMLGIWPTLPIVVVKGLFGGLTTENVGSIIAALEHHHRVSRIDLDFVSLSTMEMCTATMQRQFPNLTHLCLGNDLENEPPILPDSFLGGSSPHLQRLSLSNIVFPALPKLLLSTNALVDLRLGNIPDSGYVSPEVMVTYLSSLHRLKSLDLSFNGVQSLPDELGRPSPLLTRVDFPALVQFQFLGGTNYYIEDFVARINAPLLLDFLITFDHQWLFDIPQLGEFINRIETFKTFYLARVQFYEEVPSIEFKGTLHKTSLVLDWFEQTLDEPEEQLSFMAEVCSSFSSSIRDIPFPMERLDIRISSDFPLPGDWYDDLDIEYTKWLRLLQPFIKVKDLYLSNGPALHVMRIIQVLSEENSTELLPALRRIYIEGGQPFEAVQAAIEPFIAAREDSGHPVTVYHWKEPFDDLWDDRWDDHWDRHWDDD